MFRSTRRRCHDIAQAADLAIHARETSYTGRIEGANAKNDQFDWYYEGKTGKIFQGNSFDLISNLRSSSIDLFVTSPPFGLVREKEYGNVQADHYLDWFRPFATEMHRVLKDSGSLVIDIGGAWNKGLPTRHLYHFKLLIMLCDEFGFHLAQDFYWYNPAKLPTPAEWVTVRRVRVKDAINKVWWLSKTPWPKASSGCVRAGREIIRRSQTIVIAQLINWVMLSIPEERHCSRQFLLFLYSAYLKQVPYSTA